MNKVRGGISMGELNSMFWGLFKVFCVVLVIFIIFFMFKMLTSENPRETKRNIFGHLAKKDRFRQAWDKLFGVEDKK
jgi:uncharacterized membrane protein